MTAGDRVPPGQALTRKYPVVGEKSPAPQALDLKSWRLAVEGLIDRTFALTYGEILSLPQRLLMADIHCVTGWTQLDMCFTGFPLADLLAARELCRKRASSASSPTPIACTTLRCRSKGPSPTPGSSTHSAAGRSRRSMAIRYAP